MLRRDHHIEDICEMMHVSRSGYYKWKKRGPSRRSLSREKVIDMVKSVYDEHKVHGYRWNAAYIRINMHYSISDNYVYKCFQYLGIQSITRHRTRQRPRKVKDKYPNLIFSTWDTVDRPRQVIVSDMTAMHISYFYMETTFYFDVFTKEILTYRIGGIFNFIWCNSFTFCNFIYCSNCLVYILTLIYNLIMNTLNIGNNLCNGSTCILGTGIHCNSHFFQICLRIFDIFKQGLQLVRKVIKALYYRTNFVL